MNNLIIDHTGAYVIAFVFHIGFKKLAHIFKFLLKHQLINFYEVRRAALENYKFSPAP